MQVVEIFDSMQGEGEYMGVMSTFIRFPGCNLQCPFCDEHEKYNKVVTMNLASIISKCNHKHVILTGGEPTLQPSLNELVDTLHKYGHTVHIETNGTNPVIESINWVTCSPKAPNYTINCSPDEIKLVVSDDLPIDTAVSIAIDTKKVVWLQPCDGPDIESSKQRIVEWIKEYPTLFRAGIQLHKYYEVV